MKKGFKILLVIVIAGAAGGLIYWQVIKKKVVRQSIEKTITKKTDSLYYLHYDSSRIDEIGGNATFYNVVLQSDSAQKALLNSTDSLPNALYNIRVKQASASGVDIVGFLQKQQIAAGKIRLLKPVIQVINTGADNPKQFTMNDTLELYQKILGKFKSIKANVIQIDSGTVLFTNRAGKTQTAVENINITLNNFLVDSTKNYQNVISYFIKDVKATVENILLPPSKNNTRLNLEKIEYDAGEKKLLIKTIKQYEVNNIRPVTELKNIRVNELNTDAFIVHHQLKAGQIGCDGGVVTVYTKKNTGKSKAGDRSLELSTDMFDRAQIGGVSLGSTKLIIVNKDQPGAQPFVLNNAHFKVTKMLNIQEGITINNIINNAEWELTADGFSLDTKNKLYKMTVGNFIISNAASIIKVKNFLLKPVLTEQQSAQQNRFQHDIYNLALNDIVLSGVNIKKLVSDQALEIENASFQPIIKIFNDRTLPPEGKSKVGNYPQQQILKLPFPVYIRSVKISNASVSYRERSVKSKMTGNVFFNDINATLLNVTNIPERIKANALFKLDATAKFLGKGDVITEWRFPLNADNGAFSISGKLKDMSAATLNPIIEPLAMASVKDGQIDEVSFTMDGTDTKAVANILFLYRDLKMDMLKKGDDQELEKKGFMSMLANLLIKNKNTDRVNNREITNERDTTRSFFNLVWKTIYAGAKKTAK